MQGQRQDVERTVLSTVPTMAQRQGVFTQNIYDPATPASTQLATRALSSWLRTIKALRQNRRVLAGAFQQAVQ